MRQKQPLNQNSRSNVLRSTADDEVDVEDDHNGGFQEFFF